jgi:hypothetical protein
MKGFESVIQGYAEGGSVSSNPFEAYYRSSLANPFAGLMNLPARPQYVPRAATPTTTSPLRGYMDIYGNLAAIREEQARRRAAAAPAPQPDQPSQGSEPTTGPAPTPDPDLTLRDIETTVPVAPDFSDITSPDAGRAEEASIPTTPTAPGPVELGLPGFDESQPVIPPGLGFDSIPAPDLTLPVTREELPLNPTEDYAQSVLPSEDDPIPVTQSIPVAPPREIETAIEDYDLPPAFEDVAAMPVFDPDAVEEAPTNPLVDSMQGISPREIETGTPLDPDLLSIDFPTGVGPTSPFERPPPDLSIEYPAEALPVFDPDAVEVGPMPAEIEAIAPPPNPLQDIPVDGTIPDAVQETPAYSLADVMGSYSDDAYATPPEIEAVAGVPEAEDVAVMSETSPVYDLADALALTEAPQTSTEAPTEVASQLETAMEDYSLPAAVEEVATTSPMQDAAADDDDAYASPPEMTEVAQAPATPDVDAVLGDTASDVLSGATKDDSAKAPEKSTLADLAKTVFSGIGTTNPLGLANMLGGMAATQALKGEEEAPMSLTQMAMEKIAPSLASTGISPAAKQEMVDRGNLAGNQMAEAVAQGQISKDAAATALTNDINLVGSLGHALAALEAGTQTLKGTEDTGLALSPGDSSDGESGESDTGTAPSTDVGPPSGFDGGFGSGFDFGGYDGGFQGGDAGGSESDGGGGGSGSESDGGGGWAEGGYIPGDSGGMDDDVPALIDGKEPAKLSSGEFVFDAATVAAMGDGNNEAGAKKLNMLREAIRKKAYGHKKQPPKNFSVGDLVRLYDRMR